MGLGINTNRALPLEQGQSPPGKGVQGKRVIADHGIHQQHVFLIE